MVGMVGRIAGFASGQQPGTAAARIRACGHSERRRMPRGWTLRSSLWLREPPERVFPFFADASNLEEITPDFLRFRVVTPRPIAMRVGTRIDYRLRIHRVPVAWRTNIAEWDPPHAFADEQVRGPYRLWHHRHTFEPSHGGTLARDEVRLLPRGGYLAPLVMNLFVANDVKAIFAHRARCLVELFGGDTTTLRLDLVRDASPG